MFVRQRFRGWCTQLCRQVAVFSLLLVFVFEICFPVPTSYAQTPDSSQGLQISPAHIEINANPGKQYSFQLTLLNVTNNPFNVTGTLNDFTAKDETGAPNILLNNSLPPTSSLKNWLKISGNTTNISLASKVPQTFTITMNVPQNAEPGGHYGAVRFYVNNATANGNGKVSQVANIAMLVLVSVSGNIKEQLSIADFYTSRHNHKSVWFEHSPVDFSVRFNNTGNVHVKPVGDITVTNMFGQQVGSIAVNHDEGNVLPNSIRRFDESLRKKNLIGRYTAKLDVGYGSHGQVLFNNLSFWVIPYKQIGIVLLAVIILILLIIYFIKRYNRRIVKKVLKGHYK